MVDDACHNNVIIIHKLMIQNGLYIMITFVARADYISQSTVHDFKCTCTISFSLVPNHIIHRKKTKQKKLEMRLIAIIAHEY